jgi:hypothetical protein
MAGNTIVHHTVSKTIDIIFDGDTDYDYGENIMVQSMDFLPSATSDTIKVRAGASTGTGPSTGDAIIFYVKCDSDQDQRTKYFEKGKWMRPFVDSEDIVTSGAARLLIHYV